MNFFKILHLLLTSPAHLVYEAKMTTVKKLLLKLMAILVFVVVLSSLFNTYKSIVYLPGELTRMFPNTAVVNGRMEVDTTYDIHTWRLGKVLNYMVGITSNSNFDSLSGVQITVRENPEKDSKIPMQLHRDGILLNEDKSLISGTHFNEKLTWANLLKSSDGNFDFSEKDFRKIVVKNSIFIFIFSVGFNLIYLLLSSVYHYLLLGFVFFLSSIRGYVSREERARMILISLLPLYILLPVFTTAGAGWDYFMPLCLILSSIVLGRALTFRRKTEFSGEENE